MDDLSQQSSRIIPKTSVNGIFSYLESISWQTWIIIILILALLGINVFAYLAKGTQEVSSIIENIFGPILKLFGLKTLITVKQTIDTSATGTKAGVDIVANATTDTIDNIQEKIQPKQQISSSLPVQQNIQQAGSNNIQWQENSLGKALTNAKQTENQVNPDDSLSSIQTGKSGWCYIGEEQGIRTCLEVGANYLCMSGNVFPSQAICINPNLRT